MTLNQTQLPSESEQQTSRTWLSVSIVVTLICSATLLYVTWRIGKPWAVLPVFLAAPIAYLLNRVGKHIQGSVLLLLGLNIQFFLVLWAQDGLTVMNAAISLMLTSAICAATLPREYYGRALISALVTLIVSFFIDLFALSGGSGSRLDPASWIFAFVMLAAFTALLSRQFLAWDIRTKIVAGILGTGALALAVFIFFALNQIDQVKSSLSNRLNSSVQQLAEEQLMNSAFLQADQINQKFKSVMGAVDGLALNWSALQRDKEFVSQRIYWSARMNLIQWDKGQYGNSKNERSSVFVPAGAQVDESLITDLNTSAYLDFYAPDIVDAYPSLLSSVYAVDTRGVIRSYPNKHLVAYLSPDFNATQQAYYLSSTPASNPQRQIKWTIPYQDAFGGGELIVTVAAPVYDNEEFTGIVAADMKLLGITEPISRIKAGQSGDAFMIDDLGHILYMPQAGYDMFGIDPEDTKNTGDFFKQTILGRGNAQLQDATMRMTAGGSGLLTVRVNEVDTYISFSPVKANGYSVALVVPVAEMQGAITAATRETDQQVRSAYQTATIILILLFIMAVAVSLGLGQLIAAPIQRLTQVAAQIAGGDLSVQATSTTKDEIGTLAQSFNTMTARLRETLDSLERMVAERTAELLSANEKNERRAKQFESIAQVARTISSTRDIDVLLTQITTVISREFGFYHVGIFLLDAAKEYAILSATNSEGGRIMLQRGHRLKVGETGIVGYVTGTGNPRVALDTGADAVFFNNPDLPETRSEIALPLRGGEDIIGALDVQSTEPGAFSQEDVNILSTLADQVSVAIQNARQFEQTRKALNEAEALAKQFAKVGWQQYTKDKSLVGIRHTGARATLLYERNGSKEKEEEVWDTDATQAKSRGAFLSLPIALRGEVIGSVDVRSPDSRPWDQDELDILTAIIERAAIAMENARLLEESQRLASKEAKIGAVTAKISSSINMRNVLQTAVEELGRALPGSEVVIQFQTDQNKTSS